MTRPAAVPPAPTPASRPSAAHAAPIAPRPQIQKAPPEQSPASRASVGPKFREGLAEKPAALEATPPVEAEAAPAAPSALDQLLASGEASPAPTPEPTPGSAADLQPLHAVAGQDDSNAAPHAPAAEAKTEADMPSASEPAAAIGIGSPGYAGPMPAIKLPPSAQLQFQAKGSAKGFQYSAKAQLTFKTDGQRYQAEQQVSAFLMGSRSQTSSGQITPYGLAPERFVDKARKERSAELDTAGSRIRYSDGDEPQAISAGVQDRLSIFLQLSSMVSANPERYVPGSTVAINVTSARSTASATSSMASHSGATRPMARYTPSGYRTVSTTSTAVTSFCMAWKSPVRSGDGGGVVHQLVQRVHHVLHGTHGLEGVRIQAFAHPGLELHDEVHGVDAVDIEVIVQAGFGRDAAGVDFKRLLQDGDDALVNGFFVHVWISVVAASRPIQCVRLAATKAASACTLLKCLRV